MSSPAYLNRNPRPWKKEEDDYIMSSYGNPGVSAESIGVALKRTRHSIIGRAHRLGIAKQMAKIGGTFVRVQRAPTYTPPSPAAIRLAEFDPIVARALSMREMPDAPSV